ncbi:unnamed protein product, partial [Ilex paraguariensis]
VSILLKRNWLVLISFLVPFRRNWREKSSNFEVVNSGEFGVVLPKNCECVGPSPGCCALKFDNLEDEFIKDDARGLEIP